MHNLQVCMNKTVKLYEIQGYRMHTPVNDEHTHYCNMVNIAEICINKLIKSSEKYIFLDQNYSQCQSSLFSHAINSSQILK